MRKRKRFILTSVLLALGFAGIQFLPNQYRFISIGSLGLMTMLLFSWSLREGLGKNTALMTLVLPFFYTVGVGLFWFLLPTTLVARLPVILLYGIGIYALCLTMNIYTVAAIRTIALLRAARGVGFVITLLTMFLIFDTIMSLKSPLYITTGLVFVSAFPLFMQSFWSIPLTKNFTFEVVSISFISTLVLTQLALILFFWPVTVVVGSLSLTAASYILLGLGQARLEGRLFTQTVREYLLVGLAVFIGMFLATRWGG